MTFPSRSRRLVYIIGGVLICSFALFATLGFGLAVFSADLLAWQIVFLALCWGILAALGASHLLRAWQSVCGLGVDAPE